MSNALTNFEKVVRLAGVLGVERPEVEQIAEQTPSHPFDERNIHPSISSVSLKLFDDGHYAQATFEAFKCLDNKVKFLSGINDSGYKLMMSAFAEANPKIKLTALSTPSEVDEQMGYKFIFAGAMSAIRNPRGHDNIVDPIELCLDNLTIASVLVRRLEKTVP
ncbi:TIGR02391 family protein [Ciceribacter sp. L1K23]|uniref:TIGR02391 family protein n=1 Tax=Ciceribacter sp. L1K23 TaxID=2820276 RepID=UPI001B8412FD|nr:TIGR02391 family protein [Ciceribacter sp. L1K23]MBR0556319.1 TIGR02391 family protein [Ciceribacter sp. L1K23]